MREEKPCQSRTKFQAPLHARPNSRSNNFIPGRPDLSNVVLCIQEARSIRPNLFGLYKGYGNVYARIMNPTTDVLEKRLGQLRMAASARWRWHRGSQPRLCRVNHQAGDNIISTSYLYGGTYQSVPLYSPPGWVPIEHFRSRKFSHGDRCQNAPRLHRIVGNPKNNVDTISKPLANHEAGIPFVVDNTVATAYLFQPLKHGADIVVYSLRSSSVGMARALAGPVSMVALFPWNNGKFP